MESQRANLKRAAAEQPLPAGAESSPQRRDQEERGDHPQPVDREHRARSEGAPTRGGEREHGTENWAGAEAGDTAGRAEEQGLEQAGCGGRTRLQGFRTGQKTRRIESAPEYLEDAEHDQVETSPTCTAFALSAADGVEIAVFMDARPAPSDSGQITETVATAFRVSDGEQLWGPAPVPGPLLADAGLVFYSPQDAPIADVSGSAVMLDPFTGEQRISAESSEVEILGEYAGIGLVLAATQTATTAERVSPDEDTLQAISLADGAVLWQEKDLVRPEGVPVSASFEASTAREALLEGVMIGSWVSGADSDRFDAVAYDLESGELLTTFDGALTGNAVASEGRVYVELRVDEGVSVAAVDRDGTQWTATLAAGATAVSAGGGSVYLWLASPRSSLSKEP